MVDDPLATLAPTDPTWNPAQTVSPDSILAAQSVPPTQQTVNVTTPPPADQMATISTPVQAMIPSETAPNNPDLERQAHEAGWRKILDKVGTILGGDQTIHVKKDTDGNVTITHDPSTSGEKWGRVAAAALGGAAQGLANSQGPGGPARAAAAGIGYGLQLPQQRQQEADQDATAEQKRMLANANNARLHQDLYMQTLNAQALRTSLTAEQSTLLNGYRDELLASPEAKDYGAISSADDLMKVASDNKEFLKQHMNLQLKAVPVPDGKGGISLHAIATDPGDDARPTQKGDYLFRLDADPKTGEPILTKTEVSPGSRRVGELRTANQAIQATFMKAKNDYQKRLDDHAKAEREKVPTTYEGAVIQKYRDKYPNDPTRAMDEATREIKQTEQRRFAAPTVNINTVGLTQPGTQIAEMVKPGAKFGPGTVEGTNAQKLATGDETLDEIPKRMAKGAATPQEYLAAAEAYSQQLYGLGYSPTMVAAEKKQFENIKEQGILRGIDRMIGSDGDPGYLDTVITLGKAAGVGPNAPINEISLALKKRFGDAAASNFSTALGEVQRSLPQLIGNPLLGGSDTDLKLKQAQDMFGKHPTADNLQSTADVLRGMMRGALHSYARNNRFLQRRYGLEGAYTAQYSPTQRPAGNPPAADTSQAARQPAAPAPTKDRSISAAMALPINRGKSQAEVEADLKKFGYNPVP